MPRLRRRLAAIASRHATAGLETRTDHPLLRRLLCRYGRSRAVAVSKEGALLTDRLAAILIGMGDDLSAQRDRALLLLGYAGCFRAASS